MQYVQLDTFNGNISLVFKDDGSGEVLVFGSLKEAEDTLEENCQNGIVVPLAPIIPLLKGVEGLYIDSFAQDSDEELQEVQSQLNDILDGNT